ncbi:MAG: polysaccharide biosynthesis/export family protein [Rikenellaceae bacterium]
MTHILQKLLFMLSILLLGSCASQKQVTYFQDIPDEYEVTRTESYEIKIQADDLISIMVNSRDPKLSQMFNLPLVSFQVNDNVVGQNRVLGYLVNQDGEINFPQLGVIEIAGMTRSELTKYITQELIDNGYITDPVVTIQILNFQVSVMGEVSRPGSFEVTSDRITILDAITKAGDLTIYGMRDRVKVIREIKGKTVVTTVDLRSKDLLTSPYYYLQQNDIVYVEPNKAKAGQREINSNRTIGTFATIISVVLSALSLAL